MEFRILGPLEVFGPSGLVSLGGPRQRAFFGVLLVHRNHPVTVDRLADELWGERLPHRAVKTVQVYVSRLRSELGEGRIVTQGHSYLLRVEDGELDLDRFATLVDQARAQDPRTAARTLREALSLFHGEPLGDLGIEPWANAEVARLRELRLTALEKCLEAELELGRHRALVAELERLVVEHPLRERLRGQLMLALYRSERQADALESYQEARRLLTDELGLEPSDGLRQLQRAILAHDRSLDPRVNVEDDRAVGERLRSGSGASTFVGREPELAALRIGLDDVLHGEGRLFLVSGEPGIGKSRLVEQLVETARESGVEVLVGRCWEAGGAPAYWPWIQAMRSYLRGRDASIVREQLGQGAADIAQVLPELRELWPDLPAPPSGDPEGARFRFFDAVARFFENASAAQPLMLALDDVHAADPPSLMLLQFLAAELAETCLLAVVAYRDVDPTLAEPMSAAVTDLRRRPITRALALNGLTEREVASFVAATSGVEPTPGAISALHHTTEGNPLFVGEVVQLLAAEHKLGTITEAAASRLAVPEGVRAVIQRRLRHLSEPCRLVLVLASVLGREFGLDALERVSEVSGNELLDALDEAAQSRVVTDVPGAPGRMRFAHALIRDTLYDELAPGRRVQLHRRVGSTLEALHSANVEPHLAELAYHFFESARPADAEKALEYSRRAAEQALGTLAYEEGARLYEVALQVLDNMESADPWTRCELLLALGDAQARAGDTPTSKQTYLKAARLAETMRYPEQLGRAALGYGGRIAWDVSRDDQQTARLLDHALAAVPEEDSTLRVQLLARLAGGPLRDSTADPERRRSLAEQALEMARRIAEPMTLAYALQGYIASHHSPAFTPRQVGLSAELIQVATDIGDIERAVEAYDNHLVASLELADVQTAHADMEAVTALADELRQPAQRWLVGAYRTTFALLEGRFTDAEELIGETRSLGRRAQSWSADVSYGLQLYMLRREQGRLEEVDELVRRSAAKYPTYPIWRCVLVDTLSERNADIECRAEFETLATNDFRAIPFDEEWDVSLCLMAHAAARLNDAKRAQILYGLLLPYADRVAVSYPEIAVGTVAHFLGVLSATMARWEEADRHFADALTTSERFGARPWLAHTHHAYARMKLKRGGPGDPKMACDLLAKALATYRDLGMDTYAASVLSLSEKATLAGPR